MQIFFESKPVDSNAANAEDIGYRKWLNLHPGGFVLGKTKSRADKFTLHVAGCQSINDNQGTKRSRKTCFENEGEFSRWADSQNVDRTTINTACRQCTKRSGRIAPRSRFKPPR